MIWLRAVGWALLAACAFVVLSARLRRLRPAFDAFGIWLAYGTIGAALCAAMLAPLRSWRMAALAGLLGAGGLLQLWPHFGAATPGTDLRLRQHNLFYANDAVGLAERLDGVDVLTLQEVEAAIPVVEALAPEWSVTLCGDLEVGAPAIATRLPVVDGGCFDGGAWMRVETPAGEATFASLHLRLPWPWPQAAQMDRIIDDLASLPRPVVIAGDFNQGAWSPVVAEIETATGTTTMPGIRVTHTRRMGLIRLPIDHVLLPEGWTGTAEPGARFGSDHKAVIADLDLP